MGGWKVLVTLIGMLRRKTISEKTRTKLRKEFVREAAAFKQDRCLIITPVSRGRPDIKLAYKKMIIISEFCSDIIQLNLIIEQQICQCLDIIFT